MEVTLESKLAELRASSAEKFSDEIKDAFSRGTKELRESGIESRALSTGESIPSFELENTEGMTVSSVALLKKGPLVVTFYRGIW